MDIPFGNLLTAAATVVSVVIANRLSYSQSGRAKLWDFRREAYGVILSELASVERICDVADECSDGMFSEKLNERIAEHMKVVRQRFSDDYLILSEEFISLFNKLLTDLDAIRDEMSPPDQDFVFIKAIRTNRPLLLAQGRAEIAVGKPWHRLSFPKLRG